MKTELDALREMLAGCEDDMIRYKGMKDCGVPYLEANYAHKMRQIEELKKKIKKMEEENGDEAATETAGSENR